MRHASESALLQKPLALDTKPGPIRVEPWAVRATFMSTPDLAPPLVPRHEGVVRQHDPLRLCRTTPLLRHRSHVMQLLAYYACGSAQFLDPKI